MGLARTCVEEENVEVKIVSGLHCTLRIGSALGTEWSTSFEGFRVEPRAGNESALVGTVRDQAELHGVITRVRDLGLPLLGVDVSQEEENE